MSVPPSPPVQENLPAAKTPTGKCQVCGDGASIINYGALTCLSCRTFFRRNGFYTKEVAPCRFDNNCEINKSTRKLCTACRLTKCLAVGMSPELIRKEDLSGKKRKSSKSRRQESAGNQPVTTNSQISTLDNTPDGLYSSLSDTEQNLISNVVHAFDAFSPVADVRHTLEQINTSASSAQFDLSQSLQILTLFSKSLQLFISSTPDFKILTTSEQCSLFQRNMLGLLSIGGMHLIHESGIFDRPENETVLVPLYGHEVVKQLKNLNMQFDCDSIVVKLLLIALAFSSNCFTKETGRSIDRDSLLLGTYRLFGSQNVYVELVWKYLLVRYNYHDAAKQFSKLIKNLLDTLKLSIEIYDNNQTFQAFIDQQTEQIDQTSILTSKANVPLWGKT